MKKLIFITLTFVLFFVSLFLFINLSIAGEFEEEIVIQPIINEIRISGGDKKTTDEYIELYNPSANDISLENWKIYKYTQSATSTKILIAEFTSSSVILSKGFYLVAHTSSTVAGEADLLYSGTGNKSLASDNSILLVNNINNIDKIIDLVGYGGATAFKGSGPATSTKDNRSICRKIVATTLGVLQYVQNTSNNLEDFEHCDSNPQNFFSPVFPPPNIIPSAVITGPTTGTVGVALNFHSLDSSDPDGSIIEWSWTISGLTYGLENNFSFTFSTSGEYVVGLLVKDNYGEENETFLTVKITEPPEEEGEGEDEEEYEEEEVVLGEDVKILINEIYPNSLTDEKEWIEIYNAGSSTVNLTGWILYEGIKNSSELKLLYSPTGIILIDDFFVIDLLSNRLNNDGDIIILKNPQGEIVDQVCYGVWTSGCTSDKSRAPAKGNSIARDKNDFFETTTITKNARNIITTPIVNQPTGGGGGGGGGGSAIPVESNVGGNATKGSVVINELVSDPADGENEFVELYNKTVSRINLTGWKIEDGREKGREKATVLIGYIESKDFLTIEKPKGILNNSGDAVFLFDFSGNEIDKVVYGDWKDGDISDNAPVAKKPFSIIRRIDGLDTGNDKEDFVVTKTITKNATNVYTPVSVEGKILLDNILGIIINELFPNPYGSDAEEEFIELKNIGQEIVDLNDWKLSDATAKKYILKKTVLQPGEIIAFKRAETGIALNNTGGDEVKLFLPNNNLADHVKYTEIALEGESYSRNINGKWHWSTQPTFGLENIIAKRNAPPIIVFSFEKEVTIGEKIRFDASDTTDADGDKMDFFWNFGDKNRSEGIVVEHFFQKAGKYIVKLTVKDAFGNQVEKKEEIEIKNRLNFVGGYWQDFSGLLISEILPNPRTGELEFIEIYNNGIEELDISGLRIDDIEGGSKPFTIPDGMVILPGEFMLFYSDKTKLVLNNDGDSVRILDWDGKILLEVNYKKSYVNLSYAIGEDGKYYWTDQITPGYKNIINLNVVTKKISAGQKLKIVHYTTLEKIREYVAGDLVKVFGVVAVEPGVFSTQYFYITGSPGVQVYMNSKDFPILTVGEKIEVQGELSQAYGETRLKVKSKEDIKKIEFVGEPKPRKIEVSEIGESLEGWLVEFEGEITETKSTHMYVDDGTEEAKVYFKKGAGLNKQMFKVGEIIVVTGIINQTSSGYQVLPRSSKDIEKTGVAQGFVAVITEGQTQENKKEVAEKYLTATAGGLTSILFGLFVKTRGRSTLNFFKRMSGVAVAVVRRKKV